MTNSIPTVPPPHNEPVNSYVPGSPERMSIHTRLLEMKSASVEIPAIINGSEVRTGRLETITSPHAHHHVLGRLHNCGEKEAMLAQNAAMEARRGWNETPWEDRAAIFLRAAEMLATSWRDTLNAATMLGQSKNVHQAEIDSACELIDFLRFNVHFMQQIYSEQPISSGGTWNRLQYRGLEGFILAITPFNFTAIQGNLPTAAAMMGNTVVWKPSSTAILSAYYFYRLLEEAGLPPGVINLLPGDGPEVGTPLVRSTHLAGLHFTGSTRTFKTLWSAIGENIGSYRTYPRIVGETGGKDFIIAHPSANADAVATAIIRGGFEYQGQKCSAASRVYLAKSLWPQIKEKLLEEHASLSMGSVEDFSNFVNAVIDKKAFKKITGFIDRAKASSSVHVIAGGNYSDEIGYFIEPTLLLTDDPAYETMEEEIFGPVVTIYLYEDAHFETTLDLVDKTSPYALTGAIFSRDRSAVRTASIRLADAAGNFYINDKPTGAVVGQQPFGGGRASGTNDKAGASFNLLRWVSARTIKENLNPPTNYRYPFLQTD